MSLNSNVLNLLDKHITKSNECISSLDNDFFKSYLFRIDRQSPYYIPGQDILAGLIRIAPAGTNVVGNHIKRASRIIVNYLRKFQKHIFEFCEMQTELYEKLLPHLEAIQGIANELIRQDVEQNEALDLAFSEMVKNMFSETTDIFVLPSRDFKRIAETIKKRIQSNNLESGAHILLSESESSDISGFRVLTVTTLLDKCGIKFKVDRRGTKSKKTMYVSILGITRAVWDMRSLVENYRKQPSSIRVNQLLRHIETELLKIQTLKKN